MKFEKNGLLMLFIFNFIIASCAQLFEQKQKQLDMKATNFVKEWELPQDAKESWDTLNKIFLETTFITMLKKHRLIQDCKTCGDVFFEYGLKINMDGIIYDEVKIREEIDCRKISQSIIDDLEKKFIAHFKKVIFPSTMHGLQFQVKLGRVTKC